MSRVLSINIDGKDYIPEFGNKPCNECALYDKCFKVQTLLDPNDNICFIFGDICILKEKSTINKNIQHDTI